MTDKGYYVGAIYPFPPRLRAIVEQFRAASTVDWGDPTTQPTERLEIAGYRPPPPDQEIQCALVWP